MEAVGPPSETPAFERDLDRRASPSLAVVVLARDEEENIQDCLQSVT